MIFLFSQAKCVFACFYEQIIGGRLPETGRLASGSALMGETIQPFLARPEIAKSCSGRWMANAYRAAISTRYLGVL
jgi:hypothetical protein